MPKITSQHPARQPVHQDDVVCSGKHKWRLLVGEGNFSFALALIAKHDKKAHHNPSQSLANAIVATEYKSENTCDRATSTRVTELKKSGAKVLFGIDGTKLGEIEELKKYNFSRIHWNCPHDGSNCKDQTLPKIINNFFEQCSQIQKAGDRIHITLAQPTGKKPFYQGYYYDIASTAFLTGYTLIKKRKFDTNRYTGYSHTQTKKPVKAEVTDQGMREFVFEKISTQEHIEAIEKTLDANDTMPLATFIQKKSAKNHTIKQGSFYNKLRMYYDCSTDDDSSGYESN